MNIHNVLKCNNSITFEIENVNNKIEDNRIQIEYDKLENVDSSMDDKNNLILKNNINFNDIEEKNDSSLRKFEHKYWVDALQIFSNYLVIIIHSGSPCRRHCEVSTPMWNGAALWDSLSRSCVPLFVTISGMFFLDPEKNISISKIYKKNVYRIIKSLFFWNLFYTTINKYLVNRTEFTWSYNTVSTIIYEFFVGAKYHLWYLYMCVGLYMITPIIRPITKSKLATKYYIIFTIGILIPIQFITSLINDFFSKKWYH